MSWRAQFFLVDGCDQFRLEEYTGTPAEKRADLRCDLASHFESEFESWEQTHADDQVLPLWGVRKDGTLAVIGPPDRKGGEEVPVWVRDEYHATLERRYLDLQHRWMEHVRAAIWTLASFVNLTGVGEAWEIPGMEVTGAALQLGTADLLDRLHEELCRWTAGELALARKEGLPAPGGGDRDEDRERRRKGHALECLRQCRVYPFTPEPGTVYEYPAYDLRPDRYNHGLTEGCGILVAFAHL